MKSAGFPKSEIKNITGHSSEKGLDAYDSGNENDMCAMSAAISISSNNINEAVNKSTAHASTILKSSALPSANNFSFGIDWYNSVGNKNQQQQTQRSCFNFNNCNVEIIINNSNQNNEKKRKRLMIYIQ